MDSIAAHLDDAVRPDLLLPDAQRIARIDRDRWIGYGRAREILAELERILRSGRRQRPDNLLIIGASNNGKTAIARRFLSGTRLPEHPAATYSTIPAALDPGPQRAAHLAFVDRYSRSARTTAWPTRNHRSAARRDLPDHADRWPPAAADRRPARHPRRRRLASVLVQLREIGSVLGVSLGCFATREIAYVLRQDDQLTNRFELMTLPRWQIEDPDYWRLLHTFGRRLPLRDASKLTDPDLAAAILARSDGLIGAITRLLRQAAVEAVRTGHERIDRAMLDRVRTESPAMIEALATSDRF